MVSLACSATTQLYDFIPREDTEISDYYLRSAAEIQIVGPAILKVLGCSRSAVISGWSRGASGFFKRDSSGRRTLWIQRCGRFCTIERTAADRRDYDEALVCSFSRNPIWAPTLQSAMLLAEHCDPLPKSLLAADWHPIT